MNRKRKHIVLGLSIMILVIMAGFSGVVFAGVSSHTLSAQSDEVKVHMINVGSGDSALIEFDGHYALIDGGFATHAGMYRDGSTVGGTCRLDKNMSVPDALDKIREYNAATEAKQKASLKDTLTDVFSDNLFSFYEHFDNDLKTITGTTDVQTIMDEAAAYVDNFDESALTGEEAAVYETNKAVFEAVRSRLGAKYKKEPELIWSFMELQLDPVIAAENNDSVLFRYYTGLGYQYIYQQAHQYMRGDGGIYVTGKEQADGTFLPYNYCLDYLNRHGVTTIDYMVLSHAHKDHVGGLSAILASDKIQVKNIIYNGTSYGSGNYRVFEHEVLDRVNQGDSQLYIADDDKQNTSFTLGGKVVFTELGDTERIPAYTREPDQADDADKDYMNHIVNNQSLVYRMDYEGESMLFTGDAEGQKDAEGRNRQTEILAAHKAAVNVDILKTPHHCHNNASNDAFNKAMSPYFALTSCGKSSEPHKTARSALKGVDMWITKNNGDAIIAFISPNRFQVVNSEGKNLTSKPDYKHTLEYTVHSSFGTPNVDKARFAAGGATVDTLRYTSTKIKYYNPPVVRADLTVTTGWHYDRVQYQLCADGRKVNAGKWKNGSKVALSGDFRGSVYFRFSNRYGTSFERKTDGFVTRGVRSAPRKGSIVLASYNSVTLDWYPVAGASKYKVWYKNGSTWKSGGTTGHLYKTVKGLPAGKKVKLRIRAVEGGKYSYATIRTLRKLAKPVVRKSGSKVKVSWKKLTGAKGYQVAVNGVNKATVTGASTRLTVNKGQKLKYKVRAYTKSGGKIIYGPWSAQKSFKLK